MARAKQTDDDEGAGTESGALTSYLQSRELQGGVETRITSVTLEGGLVASEPPLSLSTLGDGNSNDLPTHLDAPEAAEVLDTNVFEPLGNERFDKLVDDKKNVEQITEEHVAEAISGNLSGRQSLLVPVRRNDGENAVATFEWRYAVTATLTDTGLGRERTVRWFFESYSEAAQHAETLRSTATESQTTFSQDGDGEPTLTIGKPVESWLERLSWEDTSATVTIAGPLNATLFFALGVYKGSPLLIGFGFFFAALTAGLALSYSDEPDIETVTVEDNSDETFISVSTLREEFGDAVFEHGGLSSRESVTITSEETSDAIVLSAVSDEREWRIPTNDTGTVLSDDHVAFFDEVGVKRLEKLEAGNRATFMVGAAGVHSDGDTTLTSSDGRYDLFPT